MLTTPDTPADLDDPVVDSPRGRRGPSLPAWVAMGFVGAFALAVLIPGTSLLEPDDYAYRASILALSQGHLWLTNAQYLAMSHHFAVADGGHSLGITQWIHQADGTWISEKNPGYPFFAVIFQWLHLTRLIPVFYGALASVALYVGGRRWLGRWGGTLAVGLFLSSGAALVFGWRWTMPTFTDASLVAIGLGLLLWSCLAGDATRRRRGIVGAVGLLALDGAVFCRYTDVVVLGTVMVAIVLVSILAKEVIPRRQLAWWLGLQVLVGAGLLGINAVLYGSATKTGYSSGEITFSFHAISGNLSVMPSPLLRSMPMLVLALVAIVVAPILFVIRRRQPERRSHAGPAHRGCPRRDVPRHLRAVLLLRLDGADGRAHRRPPWWQGSRGRGQLCPPHPVLRARPCTDGIARRVAADPDPHVAGLRGPGGTHHHGCRQLSHDGNLRRHRRRVPRWHPRSTWRAGCGRTPRDYRRVPLVPRWIQRIHATGWWSGRNASGEWRVHATIGLDPLRRRVVAQHPEALPAEGCARALSSALTAPLLARSGP